MISQLWLRQSFGAARKQAITWANVDPDLCHHMASPSQNELNEILHPNINISNIVGISKMQSFHFLLLVNRDNY